MPHISGLYLYPIKSCGGVFSQEVICIGRGIQYDREFVLVDAKGNFLSQRTVPRMALIQTSLGRDVINVFGPNEKLPPITIPLQRNGDESKKTLVSVDIWGKLGFGFDQGDRYAKWFSAQLGVPCRLLRYDPSLPRKRPDPHGGRDIYLNFNDGYPLLVISTASLADLNARLKKPVTMDRFRPNVVLDDCAAYGEDMMEEVMTVEGNLKGSKLCVRCVITTIDQELGVVAGKEPLATLATYRRLPALASREAEGVVFGRNFTISAPSLQNMRIGDTWTVVKRSCPY